MTTAAIDTSSWTAPGPGLWERDAAHQERPFSRLWLEAAPRAFAAGTSEALARFGLPFSHFEGANVDGWLFGTLVPAPDDAFPERIEAAERAIAERPWRAIADEWHATVRGQFVRRNRALQDVEPRALDDAALAAHVDEALGWLVEAATRHFLQAVAHWVGVGLLANEAQQLAGWTPHATIQALAGASPGSTAPAAAARRVADAIRADPAAQAILAAAGGDAAVALDALRACSPSVRQAIDAYLGDHGWQVFTGFDFTHEAIAELPGVLLATFRNAPVPAERRLDALTQLLAQVPPGDSARIAALIDDAVLAYGLRDDDSGLTTQLPIGLVRRALLEAGRRLESRGALDNADDVFDATAAELHTLLTGADAGLRPELAARAARRRMPRAVPPRRIGSDEPPPDGELPPAMATVMGALFTAMGLEDTPDDETPGHELRGVAASAGVYEGRARLIRGQGDFERLAPGDVLVASITTPAYNVVLPLIGAVVTDRGGVLSHPAIVAREYGVPAVVGTGTATARIPDGARVRVDGGAGTVTILG